MIEELIHEEEKVSTGPSAKKPVNSRYFIELQVPSDPEAPRFLQDQLRRHHAIEFVRIVGEWLKDNGLHKEVTEMSVTALGQIMVVCTRQVIDLIREQDIWAVAHIRSSDQFNETSLIKRVSSEQR
ncbi:MAG: hypothetical protein HY053_01835 [Proteobacteria bacterium]|nr:hypothetical protein [Pseudomonadota bacterium]